REIIFRFEHIEMSAVAFTTKQAHGRRWSAGNHVSCKGNLHSVKTKRPKPKGSETPLPNDERVVALANDILQQFDEIFGLHPGSPLCRNLLCNLFFFLSGLPFTCSNQTPQTVVNIKAPRA